MTKTELFSLLEDGGVRLSDAAKDAVEDIYCQIEELKGDAAEAAKDYDRKDTELFKAEEVANSLKDEVLSLEDIVDELKMDLISSKEEKENAILEEQVFFEAFSDCIGMGIVDQRLMRLSNDPLRFLQDFISKK